MRFKLLMICLLFSGIASAQSALQLYKAFLKSSDDFEPLPTVLIKDLQTGRQVTSSTDGYFEIYTQSNHQLEFSRLGIQTKTINIEPAMFKAIQRIVLRTDKVILDEVEVTALSKYQLDSIDRFEHYKGPLEHKKDTPKVHISPFGLIVTNPLSSWMQYIMPKTKEKLKFQKTFKSWEEQKYIDEKYKPEKIAQITKLHGDSLAWFMNAYPMPYEMARQSTEKEIEIWVRVNFSDWQINPNIPMIDSLIFEK